MYVLYPSAPNQPTTSTRAGGVYWAGAALELEALVGAPGAGLGVRIFGHLVHMTPLHLVESGPRPQHLGLGRMLLAVGAGGAGCTMYDVLCKKEHRLLNKHHTIDCC